MQYQLLLDVVFIVFNWILIISISAQVASNCPAIFQRYSHKHTYCLPINKNCEILQEAGNIIPEDIRTILKEHNKYRSNLALGKERNIPKASNMLEMVWDNELAAVAQRHAEQCTFAHDCNECRQTKNFQVGQNLYQSYSTDKTLVWRADWKAAVKSWYDEIQYFDKSMISPFDTSKAKGVVGHFTQVVWASSWRVGCGYVVYKVDNMYTGFYVCNYGPAGNIMQESMYKDGNPCSQCPRNSVCGQYPGLCKVTNENIGPRYELQYKGQKLFYCDFSQENNCKVVTKIGPKNSWINENTLSGSYMAVSLNGGETAELGLNEEFFVDSASCFVINYRKGPTVKGTPDTGKLIESFTLGDTGDNVNVPLEAKTANFYKFSMNLNWANLKFKVAFKFSVPSGSSPQYFEISDILLTKGSC